MNKSSDGYCTPPIGPQYQCLQGILSGEQNCAISQYECECPYTKMSRAIYLSGRWAGIGICPISIGKQLPGTTNRDDDES